MGTITKRDEILYDLEGDWNVTEFDLINPTNSDVNINLFDPITLTEIPVEPISTIGTPDSYHSVEPAPFNTSSVIYDTNNSKVWGGETGGAGSSLYTYKDNPPQTNPAVFNVIPTVQSGGVTGISFSPASNKIIAVSTTSGFATILNATTEAVITNVVIPVFGCSWVEYNSIKDSWYVSVAGAGVDLIIEISAITNLIVGVIVLPLGTAPQRSAFNVNNNMLYVAGMGTNTIIRIDCVLNVISLSVASPLATPYSIQINPVLNIGYVASNVTAGIFTFDTTTLLPITNILPLGHASDFQYYVPANRMYATDPVADLVYIFNPDNTLYNSIPYAGLATDNVLTINPVGDIVYFSSNFGVLKLNSLISLGAFFIGGSTDYNYFLKDILYSPAWIRRIVFYSQNQADFNQVVNHTYKDANGVEANSPLIPSLSVGMSQFQSGIGMLDFKGTEMILGINEWLSNFFVQAKSQITLILVYKQIDKSSLLSMKTPLVDTMDIIKEPVQEVSEKDLQYSGLYEYVPTLSERIYLKNGNNKLNNLISPFDSESFFKAFQQNNIKKLEK